MNHLYGTINRCSACQTALAQVPEVCSRGGGSLQGPSGGNGRCPPACGQHEQRGAGALGSPFSSMAFIKGLPT